MTDVTREDILAYIRKPTEEGDTKLDNVHIAIDDLTNEVAEYFWGWDGTDDIDAPQVESLIKVESLINECILEDFENKQLLKNKFC